LEGLVGDFKCIIFAGVFLCGFFNQVNPGARRTLSAPGNQIPDVLLLPFGKNFNLAVRQIFDPAGQAQVTGLLPGFSPITNSLYAAGNMGPHPNSLLKNAHVLRCAHRSSLRRTEKHASFLTSGRALQLSIFEQPVQKYFINNLLIILIYILSFRLLCPSLQFPSIGNVTPNVNVLQAGYFFDCTIRIIYIELLFNVLSVGQGLDTEIMEECL
jgi:hypothetical protein